MRRHIAVISLVFVALATGGCLRRDTTSTLYLSPDGGARWVVEESGVRSDEKDEGKRLEEEQAYLRTALVEAHPIARAFQAISPDGIIRTTIVRDEPPFHVITDARFSRVDQALQRLFKACGLEATVSLREEPEVTRLHMRFDFTRGLEWRESPATALLEEFERIRFVLTQGRFIEGGGFDVLDRTAARLSRESEARIEDAVESRGSLELVLTWTLER